MRKFVPVLVILFAAACGSTMNATYKGTSPQPLDPTLRCVMTAADSLGYKAKLVNGSKGVEATHNDSALTQYEDARYEKISASGQNASSADGSSSLVITAATFSQHWTRIGLETDEMPASARVKKDAQTVMARCGGAS
jgi:hypothetical protein